MPWYTISQTCDNGDDDDDDVDDDDHDDHDHDDEDDDDEDVMVLQTEMIERPQQSPNQPPAFPTKASLDIWRSRVIFM